MGSVRTRGTCQGFFTLYSYSLSFSLFLLRLPCFALLLRSHCINLSLCDYVSKCVCEATVFLLSVCVCVCVCVCVFCCFRLACLGLHWVPLGSPLASVDEESPDRGRTPSTCWRGNTNQYSTPQTRGMRWRVKPQ